MVNGNQKRYSHRRDHRMRAMTHSATLTRAAICTLALVCSRPSVVCAQSASAAPNESANTLAPVSIAAPWGVTGEPPLYGRELRRRYGFSIRTVIPDDGGPLPEGGRRITRVDPTLAGLGGAVMIAGWLSAAIGEAVVLGCGGGIFFGCNTPSLWILLPLAGPWVALTEPGLNRDGMAVVAVDGIVQLAGLALEIAAAIRRHHLIAVRRWFPELVPIPMVSSTGLGVGGGVAVSF